jgi:hypothetical protein
MATCPNQQGSAINQVRQAEITTRGVAPQRVRDALYLSATKGDGVALRHRARPLTCPVRRCSGPGP